MIRTEAFEIFQKVQNLSPEIVGQGHGVFRNCLIFRATPWINLFIQEDGAELSLTELGAIQAGLQELIYSKKWQFVLSAKKAYITTRRGQYVATGCRPAIALLKAFYLALEGEENGGN